MEKLQTEAMINFTSDSLVNNIVKLNLFNKLKIMHKIESQFFDGDLKLTLLYWLCYSYLFICSFMSSTLFLLSRVLFKCSSVLVNLSSSINNAAFCSSKIS